MNGLTEPTQSRSLIAALARWLLEWQKARAKLMELDRCGAAEIERIAKDVGLTTRDLRILAAKSADAADLLYRRMAVLGLDPTELGRTEPALLRDLQRLCSTCADHKRCALDLSENAAGSEWHDYCPNAMTLRMLVGENPLPSDVEKLIRYLNSVGARPDNSSVS
jgi:hypothetical protein